MDYLAGLRDDGEHWGCLDPHETIVPTCEPCTNQYEDGHPYDPGCPWCPHHWYAHIRRVALIHVHGMGCDPTDYGHLEDIAAFVKLAYDIAVDELEIAAMLHEADTAGMVDDLYRIYDTDDRLLYVGISNNAAVRASKHRFEKPWWPDVATIKVKHLNVTCRQDSEAVEQAVIALENPIHNRRRLGLFAPLPYRDTLDPKWQPPWEDDEGPAGRSSVPAP